MDKPAEYRRGICSQCGGEVAPEDEVCSRCGAVLRPMKEVLPENNEPETAVPAQEIPADTEMVPERGRRRFTRKAKAVVAAVTAAAVALTAVAAVWLWRSRQDVRTPLLMYKEDALYVASSVNWNRLIELPTKIHSLSLDSACIQHSRDGRYLYFSDVTDGQGRYTLYSCDLFSGNIRKVEDKVEGVYRLTPDGRTVVFLRGDELVCKSPDGSKTLAEDVQRFMLANDGGAVICQTADGELHRVSLSSGESTVIGAADEVCCISPAANSAYYVRDNVLYYWKNGQQEQKLRDAGYGVIIMNFGEEEAYLLIYQNAPAGMSFVESGEEIVEEPRQQLYYCRNGEIRLLAEDVRQYQTLGGASEKAQLLYKVQKTADDPVAWYYVQRTESSLITQESEVTAACLSGDGRELWFIAGEVVPPPVTSGFWGLQTGTLRAAQLQGGKIGAIRAVEDHVMLLYACDKGDPLYLRESAENRKNKMDNDGILCRNGKVIAEKVAPFGVMCNPETETVYFSLSADEEQAYSTLMKWNGHTVEVVEEKVVQTELLARNQVAVLSGDDRILTVYDRGRAMELGSGVSAFGASHSAELIAGWW